MIARSIQNIIEDALKCYPVTLLSGPRQTGKSTLVYKTFLDKGCSYITFDDSLELSKKRNLL